MGGRLVEIREEVPRFYSDLDKVAGEEAEARQVEPGGKEEMWKGGGSHFSSKQDCNLMLRGLSRRPRQLHIWEEVEGSSVDTSTTLYTLIVWLQLYHFHFSRSFHFSMF